MGGGYMATYIIWFHDLTPNPFKALLYWNLLRNLPVDRSDP